MNARLLAFLLAGALAASLYAQFGPGSPRRQGPASDTSAVDLGGASGAPEDCRLPALEELALDPEQEALMLSTCRQCNRRASDLAEVIAAKEKELKEALSADEMDAEHIRELAHELGQARAQMLVDCVEAVISVHQSLDLQQRACLGSCRTKGCIK